ncbi:16S rRNA methyltransferase [Paenibacillus yonginensis]|uniref:16S rRNA methyltransferase n=1 Tax=Paenibacillus yonginensis TaxID=1462996 RepID=A0A1B1N3K9_9BACL|nr:class I SAM-dependent methyltransferase [Paenibacillus yonginensis]ANS76010.1 16S rRNA methyltransferase [Paenibacillus yonginensis]
MTDHYYSSKPEAAHDRRTIETVLRGRKFRFTSDAGVFSKQGVDYGSKVLIEAMQVGSGDQVLDVGCGYGPIGLSAAVMADSGHVTMIDVNERAVQLATDNAKANSISNVTVLQSDIYSNVPGAERFDTILTNPPIRAGKSVVHAVFEGAYARLKPGGSLWIVIQKKQGAPSAKEKLEQLFSSVEEVTKDKGYRIFKAVK